MVRGLYYAHNHWTCSLTFLRPFSFPYPSFAFLPCPVDAWNPCTCNSWTKWVLIPVKAPVRRHRAEHSLPKNHLLFLRNYHCFKCQNTQGLWWERSYRCTIFNSTYRQTHLLRCRAQSLPWITFQEVQVHHKRSVDLSAVRYIERHHFCELKPKK